MTVAVQARTHTSVRMAPEMRQRIERMAEHRDIDVSEMVRQMCDSVLVTKARACTAAHQIDQRCGNCGALRLPVVHNPMEEV